MGAGFPAKIWRGLLAAVRTVNYFIAWISLRTGTEFFLLLLHPRIGALCWARVGPQKVFPKSSKLRKKAHSKNECPWTWDKFRAYKWAASLKCKPGRHVTTCQRGSRWSKSITERLKYIVVLIPGWSSLTWVLVMSIELQAPFSELEIPFNSWSDFSGQSNDPWGSFQFFHFVGFIKASNWVWSLFC